MSDTRQRDLEVFTAAVALPPGQRPAFLNQACAGDTALRQRVEALLATHDRLGDFLEEPVAEARRSRPGAPIREGSGDRIGRYTLREPIGEGGCGIVYLADQEEPVRRAVALKIIKPGMDTRGVIARFEAERQTLALMDHPNIAKVFDAGATDSGRPYFVMELVRGIRITEYCDRHTLTIEDRLRLFIQVCQAVQHAHQKGIIHRDIKPSNILVTTTAEGLPLPVVIDFGIAKATSSLPSNDKTFFTTVEMLIGTPAYMSPEQAAFTSVDVDTRTDIYGLGVLLYELLTGSTPFDTPDLLKSGLDAIRRVIQEQEPARPSAKLTRLAPADLERIARHRRSDPTRLVRMLASDLDCLVLKALEKDRTRRYATANGFALDVKRFLDHETISARPPSSLYRLTKLVRRNRLLFLGLGALALLLVVSLAIVSAALAKEQQARLEADAALQQARRDQAKAETEATRSREVTRLLEEMLEGVGPSVARGEDTRMLRGILDRTADNLGRNLNEQPAVEIQLRSVIGRLYLEIGNFEAAQRMHQAEVALCRTHFPPRSPELASALFDLGTVYWKERKLPEAEAAFSECLTIRRERLGTRHAAVAAALNSLGAVYRRQRRLEESEALTREGLTIRQQLFGDDHLEVADSLRNLSIILADRGQRAEAEAAARRMLALRRRLLGNDHLLVAASLTDLAWVLGSGDHADEVAALESEAFAIRQKNLGTAHPDLAKSAYLLADQMRNRGNLAESHAVLSAVLSIQRQLLGDTHPDVVATLRALAMTLEKAGNWAEAEKTHREVLALWEKQPVVDPLQVREETVALARVLAKLGRFESSVGLLDQVLTPELVAQPASVELLVLRLDLLGRLGRLTEAARDAAVARRHQPDQAEHYHLLATLLAKTGEHAEYTRVCEDYFARFGTTTNVYLADLLAKTCLLRPQPRLDLAALDRLAALALQSDQPDPNLLPYFQLCRALSRFRLGDDAGAIDWGTKALQGPRRFVHGQACAILAMAHWRHGDATAARALLQRGETLAPATLPQQDRDDPDKAWLAWVYARISLEEAASLIPPPAAGGKGPNG